MCQPSTSSVPASPQFTKDPWLACLIRWSNDSKSIDEPDDDLGYSILDVLDSSLRDSDSRDGLPDNVDRLSPWDMHIPYSNPSGTPESASFSLLCVSSKKFSLSITHSH